MNGSYAEDIKKYLRGIETINLFDEGKKDIKDYPVLLEDLEPKIVAFDPGFFEWKFPNETIDLIPNLKGIVTRSSWGNFIDIKHTKSKDIAVANAPGANSESVAEYAIFQMLALLRKFPLQLKDGFVTKIDEDHVGDTLVGKTAGILGYGRIGSRIASLCQAMGMQVIYWSKHKKDVPHRFVELEFLLKEADVIFKTWEIIPETDTLLNKENLTLLKESVLFISVFGGIGWCSDDKILLDLAESNKIGGFSVENEHKKGTEIKNSYAGNIFLPGAYAWFTKETNLKYGSIAAESIMGIISKKEINRVS